jgi:acyl-CoA thioester hydrolase
MTEDQPTAGRIDAGVHLLPVRVYYEDTDFTGLVYHARYLQFLERGRSDFLRLLGIVHTELLARPDPLVFAITRMDIAFKAGARIDDTLLVRTRFVSTSGARLVLEQAVLRGDEVLLEAEVEAACLTPEGRPRRPSRELSAAIAALLQDAADRPGS